MLKAIFIDFDGTLFDHSRKEVPQSTKAALKKAREKGVRIFLCSGRLKDEMFRFDLSDVYFDGLILANGALICDSEYKLIQSYPINKTAEKRLRELFNEMKFPMVIFDEEGSYVNFNNSTIEKVLRSVSTPLKVELPLRESPILSVTCYFENDENTELIKDIKEDIYMFYWSEYTANILDSKVNKKTAIEKVIRMYGISLFETMAIGDGENDIPMLKYCGVGVAMGQADEATKKAADYITDDIRNDGIYNALKHYGVIEG